jgi:putative redox protein
MKNMKTTHATVEYAGDDFFIAITPSGHAQTLDLNGQRSAAANPVELILLGVGACTGGDVISVLHKRRERVSRYRIEVRGERRDEHPRSFRRIEIRHIVSGRNISEKSLARAIALSTEKYCSVIASLRPTADVVTSYEIHEDPAAEAPADGDTV